MGAFSIWHWLVVLAVVLLMFGGRGKISALMGDFGKGLTSFKKGMKDGDTAEADTEEAKILQADAAPDAPKGDQAAKS
jgi:sec-independent protein translocase protein TatA